MRRHSNLAAMFATWVVLWMTTATAQEHNGGLSGLVTDPAHAILQGARVELQPTAPPTVTNHQGEYTFTGLAPGKYTVTISFVGLAPFTREATVNAGEVTRVNAELQVASVSESVTVTAERVHGEAEAINRQRSAENVLQVLPAEVITSLPNANVADALGRLPSVTLERDEGEGKYVQIRGTEPRYSNVTIDGVNVPSPESGVRQIKLDVIPSALVESVEINKTLLANMDGDGIGGSVNLRTKSAGEKPMISLFGLGGYTPIQVGRTANQFGGAASQRFGPEKRLGILFGGAFDWNGRGIDDIEPSPKVIQCDPGNCLTPGADAPYYGTYSTMDRRLYTYYRARYGFSGTVDYKFSQNSGIYVRGLYSHFDNFGDRWVLTPTINSFTTSPAQGGPDGSMSYNAEIRRPVEVIGSLLAGGRHDFQRSWFTWEISASRASSEDHGYSTAGLAPGTGSPLNAVQFGLDRSNPYRPQFIVQNGVNIYDTTQYLLQGFDISTGYSPQVNLQGAASYARQYNWAGHYGAIEFGGKVRNAHKFDEPNDVVYSITDPTQAPLSMFPIKQTVNHWYDGSYRAPAAIDYSKLLAFYHANPSLFTTNPLATLQSNASNLWDLIERVDAFYVMNTINFNRFRLNTGIRFETTTENVAGSLVAADDQGNLSISGLKKNTNKVDPLPSAELRIALTADSAIRLAYSRGVARPNFGDLAPNLSLGISTTGGVNSSSIGNPNLRATHANNYDLLFEQYLKPLGLLQAGFFYKDIGDPIISQQTQNVHYPGYSQGFIQTQPINAGSARVWGFEVAYQQRLAFLPGPMAGLGFSGNYGYAASRANDIPGRTDHPALLRQAPHTWNLSPTFDRGRISLRVGLSYNAANIFSYQYQDGVPLGLKGPLGDNYLYAHLQVDAQSSIRLAKGFSAVVYGLNLTNEVFGFYYGSTIWPVQREYYKTTIGAGLRWNSIER